MGGAEHPPGWRLVVVWCGMCDHAGPKLTKNKGAVHSRPRRVLALQCVLPVDCGNGARSSPTHLAPRFADMYAYVRKYAISVEESNQDPPPANPAGTGHCKTAAHLAPLRLMDALPTAAAGAAGPHFYRGSKPPVLGCCTSQKSRRKRLKVPLVAHALL